MQIKNYEILTQHAYWVVDHYTNGLDHLRGRAATIIGLIGVEIGFLATWGRGEFSKNIDYVFTTLLIVALLGLVFSLTGFMYCLGARRILRPTTEQILWALDESNMSKDELHKLPILAITNKDESNGKEMFDALVDESASITKIFNSSLYSCVLAQVILIIFIYLRLVTKGE